MRQTIRYQNEDLAVWTGHPGGERIPFDLRQGRIVVKNPDGPTLDRLRDLASALGARLQGDDGEFYDASDAIASEEPDLRFAPSEHPIPSKRRRFWHR